MLYMGSKARLADWLIGLMKPYLEKAPVYCEPFVGGANLICRVPHPVRIGSDSNKYLIALLKKVQEDSTVLPATIDKETYENVRKNQGAFDPWYVGMVAFCGSQLCFFWGGYSYEDPKSNCFQRLNNLRKQAPLLKGIEFRCIDYRRIRVDKFPPGSLFYCDPPYKDTAGYKGQYFDHDAFYRWCGMVSGVGHIVLLSEFQAPPCFEELGSVQRSHPIDPMKFEPTEVTERLFIYRG